MTYQPADADDVLEHVQYNRTILSVIHRLQKEQQKQLKRINAAADKLGASYSGVL